MGAAQRDLQSAHAPDHRHDVALDPGSVVIDLARNLLGLGQDRLDLAEVHQHQAALGRLGVGLDDARDDVALVAGVLAVGVVVLGVAQPLDDDLLGGHRGDPSEVRRGVIELLDQFTVLAVLGGPDCDGPALAVNLDPRMRHRVIGVSVGRQKGRLESFHHRVEGDLFLPLDAAQG
jgi:hypothetical protein